MDAHATGDFRRRVRLSADAAEQALQTRLQRREMRAEQAGGDVVADFHAWLQERCQRPLPAFTAAPEVNKGMTAGAVK